MKKPLLAISAIALGASLLGVAAPAHADEVQPESAAPAHTDAAQPEIDVTATSDAVYRRVVKNNDLYPTPRFYAPIEGAIRAGDVVWAICTLQNGGSPWVKVALDRDDATIGYVSPDTLETGSHLKPKPIPTTCPSEVTVVPRTAYAKSFGPGEGDILPAFRCPADYPYLKNEGGHGLVTGVQVTTTGDSGVGIGLPLQRDGYQNGYSGGTAGNIFGAGGSVTVLATCTSDVRLAKKG